MFDSSPLSSCSCLFISAFLPPPHAETPELQKSQETVVAKLQVPVTKPGERQSSIALNWSGSPFRGTWASNLNFEGREPYIDTSPFHTRYFLLFQWSGKWSTTFTSIDICRVLNYTLVVNVFFSLWTFSFYHKLSLLKKEAYHYLARLLLVSLFFWNIFNTICPMS